MAIEDSLPPKVTKRPYLVTLTGWVATDVLVDAAADTTDAWVQAEQQVENSPLPAPDGFRWWGWGCSYGVTDVVPLPVETTEEKVAQERAS